MKKILSLLLSVLLAVVPMSTVLAADGTLEVSEIHSGYEITVTAKTILDSATTLKVFPISAEGAAIAGGTAPIYINQLNGPTGIADGKNIYTFTFDFADSTPTGWYRVLVNNETAKAVDFKYCNAGTKATFFEELKAANAAGIDSKFDSYKDTGVDMDMGDYYDYDPDVQGKIGEGIDALDASLPADLGISPTHDEVKAYIEAFELVLLPELERLLTVAEIVTAADAAEFDALIQANKTDFSLDMTYYDDAVIALEASDVYGKISVPEEFTNEKLSQMFNVAVLLAVIENADAGTITTALSHYDGEGITLDTTYSSQFTTDTQHNSLSTKIKSALASGSITSAATLEAKYLELSEDVLEGGGSPDPSPSPSPSPNPGPTPSAPPAEKGEDDGAEDEKPVEEGVFADVNDAPWAKYAIEYLVEEGVLDGKGDGKFYPNDTVTREEFVKIIVTAVGLLDKGASTDFTDVSKNRWSYEHIASAFSAGIITGDGKSFNPAGQITRQDMAAIIYRTTQYVGLELKGEKVRFNDYIIIPQYAQEAVSELAKAGIINGTGDNMFTPAGIVTRAQAAKIVYELLMAIEAA